MNLNDEKKKMSELQKKQSVLITKLPQELYHYRTLEGFWNIIESESFWATNARFSNDNEEQKLGIKLIQENMGTNVEKVERLLKDCYIICFCEDRDCLSQWRSYGQGGVSIGFDFSDMQKFYIVKESEGMKKYIEYYNRCCKVAYFSKEVDKNRFEKAFLVPPKDSEEKLPTLVPFIKHEGFQEEKEYRLVFEGEELEEYVQYRNQKGRKIPYIIVKSGIEKKEKLDKVYLRLVMEDTKREQVKMVIEGILDSNSKLAIHSDVKIDVQIIECGTGGNYEDYCVGCVKKRFLHLLNWNKKWVNCKAESDFYYEKENAIYISDCTEQEEIFKIVYNELHKKLGKNVPKVWCEGHLPIRTIRVGPGAQKAEIKESIEHYCKHTYWLKDVDVDMSDIPYRS